MDRNQSPDQTRVQEKYKTFIKQEGSATVQGREPAIRCVGVIQCRVRETGVGRVWESQGYGTRARDWRRGQ